MIFKILKYLFIFNFLIILNLSSSKAVEKIVYIDMVNILNTSDVGKYIVGTLEKESKKNIKLFNEIKSNLIVKEKKLLASKNVIDKADFNKEVIKLKKEFDDYQKLKANKRMKLSNEKNVMQNKLLKILTPIVSQYSKDNSISIVITKQNVFIGRTDLDITKDILELVNKKHSKL